MKVAKKTIRIAQQYAALAPEHGQADMNAAIVLAKALLRMLKNKGDRDAIP